MAKSMRKGRKALINKLKCSSVDNKKRKREAITCSLSSYILTYLNLIIIMLLLKQL